MIRRSCEMCGDHFHVKYKSNTKRFCSKSCANSRSCPTRKTGKHVDCEGCGESFYAKKYKIENNRKLFCSWECQKVEVKKICEGCGATFYHKKYRDRSFCSRECSNRSGGYRKNGIDKNCKNCGDSFYTPKCEKNRLFCSKKCADSYCNLEVECKGCGDLFSVRASEVRDYCSRSCWHENVKVYPKTSFLRKKIRLRKSIEEMDDRYLKGLIPLPAKDIPQELIELKRLNIKRKRIIRTNK